eukprot:786199-Rhodomonas_salina.1
MPCRVEFNLTVVEFYDKYLTSTKNWQRKSWKCTLRPSHCTAKGAMEFFVSERREIDENYVRLTMFSSESFMKAAVWKGYINSGNEGILAFNEACYLHRTPRDLRAFL